MTVNAPHTSWPRSGCATGGGCRTARAWMKSAKHVVVNLNQVQFEFIFAQVLASHHLPLQWNIYILNQNDNYMEKKGFKMFLCLPQLVLGAGEEAEEASRRADGPQSPLLWSWKVRSVTKETWLTSSPRTWSRKLRWAQSPVWTAVTVSLEPEHPHYYSWCLSVFLEIRRVYFLSKIRALWQLPAADLVGWLR